MTSRAPFDPFGNRLSRDIRNSLSTAFAEAVEAMDGAALKRCAATWLESALPDEMAAFIAGRMRRYDRVLDRIHSENISDPCRQALIAWNEQLFFEVHEILEEIWHPASGPFRKALQGLILAAGIGEHLQYGHARAAQRLASRADQLLRQNREQLDFIVNLEELLAWLQDCEGPPPELRSV
jgi:hypothetical protein